MFLTSPASSRRVTIKLMGESNKRQKTVADLSGSQFNLVVNAVHELKSPLVLIQGLANMLLDQEFGSINTEQRQAIERIAVSSQRLLRLIDGLLNIGRWREKSPRLIASPIAMPDLLNSVLEELKPIITRRSIIVKRDYKKIVPSVLGDWQLVYQIIFNLVDNALKYSPPRSSIQINLSQKGGFLHVRIRDHGIGINPKEVGLLFERFGNTGKQVFEPHAGSSGLGLFIVKNLAELHGGFVSVKPLARGTSFNVGLPITDQLPLFNPGSKNK